MDRGDVYRVQVERVFSLEILVRVQCIVLQVVEEPLVEVDAAILSAATFASYSLFFAAAGVPYAVLLATIAGVLEFIPVAGPLSAAAAALLVAGFSGYPHLLWMVVFLIAYRLFQDYVLQPYLMSSGVEVHPLLIIFGVLAGEQVGGVTGMFLSIPVIATLRVVFLRLRKTRASVDLGG